MGCTSEGGYALNNEILQDEWVGCYRDSWKGIISDAAFQHPAKFSRALIRKIYAHVTEEGWVRPNQTVVDPFGGVALGAYDAMQAGLNWTGVELEQKFQRIGDRWECPGFTKKQWERFYHRPEKLDVCDDCRAAMLVGAAAISHGLFGSSSTRHIPSRVAHHVPGNIELWEQKNRGTARLIRGDSRRLAEVLRSADLVVSSPPYGQRTVHGQSGIDLSKNPNDRTGKGSMIHTQDKYGDDPAQLGNMPATEDGLNLAVSSPPYVRPSGHSVVSERWDAMANEKRLVDPSYGKSEGQLAAMPEGEINLALSSPPYAGNSGKHDQTGAERAQRRHDRLGFKQGIGCFKTSEAYGDTEGQLGGMDEGDLNLAVTSPPYAGALGNTKDYADADKAKSDSSRGIMAKAGTSADRRYGSTEGQLGAMKFGDLDLAVSSPPYIDSVNAGDHGIDWSKVDQDNPHNKGRHRGEDTKHGKRLRTQLSYTENPDPGNLGAMGQGDFTAAISSPPYEGSQVGSANDDRKGFRGMTDIGGGSYAKDGQISAMPSGDFDAAISSPPFENVEGANAGKKFANPAAVAKGRAPAYQTGSAKGHPASEQAILAQMQRENHRNYGQDPENLGNQKGDDFWSASRIILEQLYQVLTPGAHAVFVVKAFVRNGKIVDFPDRWRQLCEAVGFKLLHHHHALLTEEYGEQHRLDGDVDKHTVARKSFFRRLAEKNGSPAIDWESILCFAKGD